MRIGEYETHPVADAVPLMVGDVYDRLVENITDVGLLQPIWLYKGLILDGRNRLRACIDAEVEPRFKELTDDTEIEDLAAFVLSMNHHRRHLTLTQRAMASGRLDKLVAGRPAKTLPVGSVSKGLTTDNIAEELDISPRTVARAREVIDNAVPEIVQAVDDEVMSVRAGSDASRLPPEKQREIAAKAKDENVRAMIDAEKPKPTRSMKDLVSHLKAAAEAFGAGCRWEDGYAFDVALGGEVGSVRYTVRQ